MAASQALKTFLWIAREHVHANMYMPAWNTECFSRSRMRSARITGAPMPVFLEGYGESEGIYKIARAPRHPKAMAYGGQSCQLPGIL